MKCTMCDGTGQEKVYDKLTNAYIFIKCACCNGTGEMPITNDEWRKTCPTEEFAEFLNFIAFDWNRVDKQWVLEWLKQPHAPQKQDDYPCNVKGCTMETRQSCCGCPDYFKWKEQQDS